MDARQQYETAGRALVAEIEALPKAHPLVKWLAGSRQYRASSEENPFDDAWQGSPTRFGVKEDYLFRYDLPASLTRGKLNQGEGAARILALAERVREAGDLLRSRLKAEFDEWTQEQQEALEWLDQELAGNRKKLETAGYSVEEARRLITHVLYGEHVVRLHRANERMHSDSLDEDAAARKLEEDCYLLSRFLSYPENLDDREAVRREIRRLTGEA